jgi:hypothetical protein
VTSLEARIVRLELALARAQAQIATLTGQAAALETSARQASGMPYGWGGGGDGAALGFIGKAVSAIDARTGTALAAGGQVDAYYDNAGTLTATGTNVIARCAVSRQTAAGHGIDAGGWCWVEKDATGTYWASPLDCT